MMKHKSAVTILLLVPITMTFGQGSAGSRGTLEPRFLVDMPTAGMIDKGSLCLDVDVYQAGGVLLGLSWGVLDRFSLGISYGGSGLIGSDTPSWNPLPAVDARIRLAEESTSFPALVIGFNSQGHDAYLFSVDRYTIKSPGIFLVVSKNYSFLGYLSLHGGANYSFETADGDKDPNYYCGIEKTIGPTISLVAEYNAGLNDNDQQALGHERGYLNAGIRWSLGAGVTVSLNFRDLVRNAPEGSVSRRTIHLEYSKTI